MAFYHYTALLLAIFLSAEWAVAEKLCGSHSGTPLTCAVECCVSFNGRDVSGYYCCGADNIQWNQGRGDHGVATVHTTSFHIDWTLLLLGLVISIVLSVLLSLLCCLVCNGCWLHRRRNAHLYGTPGNARGEGQHHRDEDAGFYPLCCGFGIPIGTLVFSTNPPRFSDQHPPPPGAYYDRDGGASTVTTNYGPARPPPPQQNNGNGKVHFSGDEHDRDEHGQPRGVLKHPSETTPAPVDPHYNQRH